MLLASSLFFSYKNQSILSEISFKIKQGQIVALIGESGSGKSTLLKLIYGMYDLDTGQIFYNNKQILGPKHHLIPGDDDFKYLAQDFDLMPYITVEENIGKFLSNINLSAKKSRIEELLTMVEMNSFAKTKVQFLSGGQQQRVALAKVLALEPKVLLLDEPFSQIDNFRKNMLQRNLFRYLKEKKITCLIATHDAKDILSFTDQTIVLQNGYLTAISETKKLYQTTQDNYIASLFEDVNELPKFLFDKKSNPLDTILVYPYQLVLVEESNLKVKINHCFFKGNVFLIEAFFEDKIIYFENQDSLIVGSFVFLNIKKKSSI